MKTNRRNFIKSAVVGATAARAGLRPDGRGAPAAQSFRSAWPDNSERVFVGPEYWANRLQDWRISAGRLECVDRRPASPMRTLHLLTHRLGEQPGSFQVEVRTGLIDPGIMADGAGGFLIGAGGRTMDYRAAALIHHQPGPGGGLFAGCTARGTVFFRDFETAAAPQLGDASGGVLDEIRLRLDGVPDGNQYRLTLTARTREGRILSRQSLFVSADKLIGNVALVSHPGTGENTARFWFREWRLEGDKIEAHPERVCGPILSALYTIHRAVLKVTAQLMPVGANESQSAELQFKQGSGWKTAAKTTIVPSGWTAHFRIENWDARRDTALRVRYLITTSDGKARPHDWTGTIKRDPVEKTDLVLASLSCVQQIDGALAQNPIYPWKDRVWFPHAEMTRHIAKHQPALFFFAGDQIYAT